MNLVLCNNEQKLKQNYKFKAKKELKRVRELKCSRNRMYAFLDHLIQFRMNITDIDSSVANNTSILLAESSNSATFCGSCYSFQMELDPFSYSNLHENKTYQTADMPLNKTIIFCVRVRLP